MSGCPTLCDPTCDTVCHESHRPAFLRQHSAESCSERQAAEIFADRGVWKKWTVKNASWYLAETRKLLSFVYKPAGVELWMRSRHAAFNGQTALVWIIEGRGAEVVEQARRLL